MSDNPMARMKDYIKDIKEEKETLVHLLNTIHRQVHACVSYVNTTPERSRVNRTDILKIKNFELKLIQKLSELSVELRKISVDTDRFFKEPKGSSTRRPLSRRITNIHNTVYGPTPTPAQESSGASGSAQDQETSKGKRSRRNRNRSPRAEKKYIKEALKLIAEELDREANNSENGGEAAGAGAVSAGAGSASAGAATSVAVSAGADSAGVASPGAASAGAAFAGAARAVGDSSKSETKNDLLKIHRHYAKEPVRVVETFRYVTDLMGLDEVYVTAMLRFYSKPFSSGGFSSSSDDDYDSDDDSSSSSDSLI